MCFGGPSGVYKRILKKEDLWVRTFNSITLEIKSQSLKNQKELFGISPQILAVYILIEVREIWRIDENLYNMIREVVTGFQTLVM